MPFAETNEQLAGYYVVEAGNLDEATAIAARIPTAKHGSVEVQAGVVNYVLRIRFEGTETSA